VTRTTTDGTGSAATGRAVVLVGNPAAPYSRGLRIARALAAEGFAVEIAAITGAGLPDRERDGDIEIRRYRPSGWTATMAATYRDPNATRRRRRPVIEVPRAVARRTAAALRRWIFWPHTVRGWWATLEDELAPADVYHACGSLTIAPALAARRRDAGAGRRSIVIYDAIDNVFEGNSVLGMPAPVRAVHRARERRWARSADARTTVNEALAARLRESWGIAEPPLVLPNYPERVADPDEPVPDLVREALGLPPATRVVEFQGRLGPNLGLDEAAEAVLRVPDAVLAVIGFGRWEERSRQRDADPRFTGRHFTLPAVHPDELLEWTSSADIALVPLPPVSANQRASTPNKFWEAIAAGTPVVVAPGLEVMARLVTEYGLGVVARSLAADDLAAAIRSLLDRPADERTAERRRLRTVAAERFSWPVVAAAYRTLVRDRLGRAGMAPPGG
jgi:glycosyltransferase involved in cell wall biosynthesis